MKKIFLFTVIASLLICLASCSQEKSVSLIEDGRADVVIVQASENDIESDAAASRYNFVRQAMDSRDIDMVADSKPDEYCKFTFTLPEQKRKKLLSADSKTEE